MAATHVACGCAVGSQTGRNGNWRIEGPEGSIDWQENSLWHTYPHRTSSPVREEIFPTPQAQAEQAILNEFLSAIGESRLPECSAEDNLMSLAMTFGAMESAKTGRRMDLTI